MAHKLEVIRQEISIICKEYPKDFEQGVEPYCPVKDAESDRLYQKYYLTEAKVAFPKLILGERLGVYKYWNMDVCVKGASEMCRESGF